MKERRSVLDAWEQLADAYAARVESKAHNALYERPATLSLLPPVNGKRVLDAGCGPGIYAQWIVEHGAEVVGIDLSPRMVGLAAERVRGNARFHVADFGRPLDFLEPGTFDLVVSSLALDFVEDWGPAFQEFFRLLRPSGHFVFSVNHPSDDFYDHHPDGNYFHVEPMEASFFGRPVSVPYFRRPLSAILDPLLDAGFALDRLLEPQPLEGFEEQDPEDYEKLMRRPGFICLRASKGPAA